MEPQQELAGISIQCRDSEGDYPRGYEIYVSMNSFCQGSRIAKGEGDGAVVVINFAEPVSGRSLKIVQMGKSGPWHWTIAELKITTERRP